MTEPKLAEVGFDGLKLQFRGATEEDHVFEIMIRSGYVYERDVLEVIRQYLAGRTGLAVDVGAFIGTHSVVFCRAFGLNPILAFEANPDSYAVLRENLAHNDCADHVVTFDTALGARSGTARLRPNTHGNQGGSVVDFSSAGPVAVTTLDEVLERRGNLEDVALIKIDVEGSEPGVLNGARRTIRRFAPLLCVEVYGADKFKWFTNYLTELDYWIVDCRGASPNYIAARCGVGAFRRRATGCLWRLHSVIRSRKAQELLRRTAARLTKLGAGTRRY